MSGGHARLSFMRKTLITNGKITHVQNVTSGQIWRWDDVMVEFPFVAGRIPYVSNIKPNRYDHRPAGKR